MKWKCEEADTATARRRQGFPDCGLCFMKRGWGKVLAQRAEGGAFLHGLIPPSSELFSV